MLREKTGNGTVVLGYEERNYIFRAIYKIDCRRTDSGGNNGFKSDQNLNDPVFYGITGQVEVDK